MQHQIINQIYCAAPALSYSPLIPLAAWEQLSKLILTAQYESCICCAMKNAVRHTDKEGSRKLFLTMLGTGAYGNDPQWVWEVLGPLCTKYTTTDLEIYVVNHSEHFPENLVEGQVVTRERDDRPPPGLQLPPLRVPLCTDTLPT